MVGKACRQSALVDRFLLPRQACGTIPQAVRMRSPNGLHFREFDLASFRYPTGVATNSNNVPTSPLVLLQFSRLNKMVLQTNPTNAISQLINGWYPSPLSSSFTDNFVPPGWSSGITPPAQAAKKNLYKEVVEKSCRTCHVAIGNGPSLDWTDYATFESHQATIQSIVCSNDSTFQMPHAWITYLNYWRHATPTYPAKSLAQYSAPSWPQFPITCQ